MKPKLFPILAVILIISFFSCKKEQIPFITVSSDNIMLSDTSLTAIVSVNSNYNITISSSANWLTFTASKINDITDLKLTAKVNPSEEDRFANVTISAGKLGAKNTITKNIKVTQSSAQLFIDYDAITFEKIPASKLLLISSNTSWSLEIEPENFWLHLDRKSGSGNSQINIFVDENFGGDRISDIKIKYSDKIKIIKILQKRAINSPPSSPVVVFPVNNSINASRLGPFRWQKSIDPDGDIVRYELQISTIDNFDESSLISKYLVDTMLNFYSPILLKENTKYFWRVISVDTYTSNAVSTVNTFTTGTLGGYVDGEYRVALSSSKGTNPNEIIFIGDGYTVQDYLDGGKFDSDVQAGINAFFNIEPYKSYKDYFKIFKIAAYSKESGVSQQDKGISKITAFSTNFKGGSSMETNTDRVFEYATKISGMQDDNLSLNGIQGKLQNVLIILIVNQDRYAGTCWSWSDGKSIAICPVSTSTSSGTNYRNIINHEAGGHGFGRLADEYVTSANKDKTITDSDRTNLTNWQKYGFYPNVDLTSDMLTIKWKHFSGKTGYSVVGAFQGAYYYTYGVWRPETSSCMIFNEPYYNAPSRENMVKRILRTAAGVRVNEYVSGVLTPIPGDPYNFDTFVTNDIQKSPSGAAMLMTKSVNPFTFVPLAPPVMVKNN